jgi:anti-anti-sigma regulatory factor
LAQWQRAAVGIEVRKEGRRATLVPGGKLTPEDADLLRKEIDELLREGCRELVLDLERVLYIDSEA